MLLGIKKIMVEAAKVDLASRIQTLEDKPDRTKAQEANLTSYKNRLEIPEGTKRKKR
jgi:hypothetical protein